MIKVFFVTIALLGYHVLFSQDTTKLGLPPKVIEDCCVEMPKLKSSKNFGTLLKERFKDSIPDLDSLEFQIYINKSGRATRVKIEKSFGEFIFTNEVLLNLQKIRFFIINNVKWRAAYQVKGKKRIYFAKKIFEIVKLLPG